MLKPFRTIQYAHTCNHLLISRKVAMMLNTVENESKYGRSEDVNFFSEYPSVNHAINPMKTIATCLVGSTRTIFTLPKCP